MVHWFTEELARSRLEELRGEGASARLAREATRARPVPAWRAAVGRRLLRAGLRVAGLPSEVRPLAAHAPRARLDG